MGTTHRSMRAAGALAAVLLCGSVSLASETPAGKAILDASGVRGGLVVCVGCGDGRLIADLRPNDRYLVQGLDTSHKNVAAARRHLRSLGFYGDVSVRQWDAGFLPYGDNLVNLLVVDRPEAIPPGEIARVLAPRGVAMVRGSLDTADVGLKPREAGALQGWSGYAKPVPEEIDDWTHYLHDAGNNAVAQDDRVGPPRHLQWKNGPMWCRSHEFASSVHTLISADGRLIGIFDEGIIGQPRGVPAIWTLIARDAFNGKLLWRRPCARVNPQALTAAGNRVYVTLRSRGPLMILDAATGETLHECKATGLVDEIALCDGLLLLSTNLSGGPAEVAGPHVVAASPDDGNLIWKHRVGSMSRNTMVAGEGRVCYFEPETAELVCLSTVDGEEQWREKVDTKKVRYAVLYDGVVFLTGGATRAYSLSSGEHLWTGPDGNPHARNPPGLFGAQGLVWRAWEHVDPRSFVWQHREEIRNGYDPRTGEIKETITAKRLVTAGHHIRCYPPKATHRYLLLNKRGVEFFDLEGTNHMRANWTRGACGYGMLPANGFLYTPPSQCFCYQGVLLTGLNALAAAREVPQEESVAKMDLPRLEKGPAYDRVAGGELPAESPPTDWPTYRHDVRRSGSIDASLPVALKRIWQTRLCPSVFADQYGEQKAGQSVLLQAADATIHGDGARLSGNAIIAWRGKDTRVSWEAELNQTGRQPVWLLQANMGKGGSVFGLSVGEQRLTGKIRHTDDWGDYIWISAGEVEIPKAGTYTVKIEPLEQVEGRLGNVAAVAIGGQEPPARPNRQHELREYAEGALSPPVAAAGKIFVAEPDAHAVHAIDGASGRKLWTFTADARVDSPPTIYRGLCLFGGTDGHVYCLSADDGELAWRFRAAPEERQLCVMDQVESAWPVHGSVLVRDDKVYCTAGRSSYLDGGIYVYALDPRSGRIMHEAHLRNDEPDVSRYGGRPFDMEGSRSDILVAGEEDIYLFQNRFNEDLSLQPMPRITKLGDRRGEPHLMTNDGFLDKEWFNRTYWTYSDRWPGYYFTYRGPKSGQILVFDDENTYALKVYTKRHGHSPEFQPGTGYHLIADRNTTEPVLDVMEIGAEKGRGYSRTELPIWAKRVPIRAQGLLLANERLYLVGPPDLPPEQGAYEAMIGKRGAWFRVVSTENGETLGEFEMDDVPVFDGLIAAGGRLYMTTLSGTLICLGSER